MVSQTKTKIHKVGYRHTLYFEKAFVQDSAFPFKPDEEIVARIDGDKVVLEKPSKR